MLIESKHPKPWIHCPFGSVFFCKRRSCSEGVCAIPLMAPFGGSAAKHGAEKILSAIAPQSLTIVTANVIATSHLCGNWETSSLGNQVQPQQYRVSAGKGAQLFRKIVGDNCEPMMTMIMMVMMTTMTMRMTMMPMMLM